MALDVVSAREAARRIGKNERTVRRWIVKDAALTADKQRLPGADIDEHTGEFRVPVAALRPYLPARVERSNGTVVDTATGEVTVPDEAPTEALEDLVAETFNVAAVLPREHMVSVPLTLLLDLQARCARAEALLELWPPSNPEQPKKVRA